MNTKQTEYEQQLHDAIALDRIAAENKVVDVSNLGDSSTMRVTTADGNVIELRIYGR